MLNKILFQKEIQIENRRQKKKKKNKKNRKNKKKKKMKKRMATRERKQKPSDKRMHMQIYAVERLKAT